MDNKFLYHCFDKWFENSNDVYIISDPHFNDPEMEHIRKNYISDDEQIKRINSVCGKKSTLIILGDIGDISCVSKLRAGYKVLIKGNHDVGSSKYKRVREEIETFNSAEVSLDDLDKIQKLGFGFVHEPDKIKELGLDKYFHKKVTDNHLFDEVYEGPLMISEKVMLSHEPLNLPNCIFNIHGHDHSNWFVGDNHLNVCAEHIDYTPINLLSLFKNGHFKSVEDIHRITIDRATEKKLNRGDKID